MPTFEPWLIFDNDRSIANVSLLKYLLIKFNIIIKNKT
jgi:hypothetical protein